MTYSIEGLIGNTPLVLSKALNPNPKVDLYFKLEGQNPGGSIKDRAAYFMVKRALERNLIDQNTQLIEATSGNTGIALAMICAQYGLSIELVMPENSTVERVKTMQAYGAKVTLTPADVGIEGARIYAEEKINQGYFSLNQFANTDNRQAHIETTGPEIWRDTNQQITHFVATMGTTGTISGIGSFLKSQDPNIRVVGVQPEEGARIPGIRKWSEAFLPGIYTPEVVDDIRLVGEDKALQTTKELASKEAIFAGLSSGGGVYTALQLCREIESGCVVVIICDRGDRYLSELSF